MISAGAALVLGLAGAVGGSFASTAALRTLAGEQVLGGRSRCDGCRRSLALTETVPVLSYVARRGRCASCRARINPAHPVSEIVGAAAAIVLGLVAPSPAAFAMTVMSAALLAAAVIDARTQRLPDPLTLVVGGCAAFLAARSGLGHLGLGVLAALISATVLMLLRGVFVQLRGDPSLGFGDVKLVASLAIWLGSATAAMVACAAVLALVLLAVSRPRSDRIAFGPMLALAGWSIGVAMEVGIWPG
jgi:leader peptidase (prepilin peptidase)/N-methyltransferase